MDDELQSQLVVSENMPMDNENHGEGQCKTGIIKTYVDADVCASNMETQSAVGVNTRHHRQLTAKALMEKKTLCKKRKTKQSKQTKGGYC